MLVSWNWLRDYLPLEHSVAEVEQRLMMAGLNHEFTTTVGDDTAIDFEVTSNRPDCLGHLGIAREIAVLFDLPLHVPQPAPRTGSTPVSELASVEVRCPELCPRYTARVIRGVRVGPSPSWLVNRLATIYRPKNPDWAPINNVVDITNYVLMECGQPLHAFDLQRLAGRRIVVREALPGERFLAINHRTYELQPGMCVIADAQRAVALGGVMGGADTEVSAATRDLLIESAMFAPLAIRTTARKLALHSDSSYRFERGVDPEQVDWASRRCCEMILELAGGELAQGVIDVGAPPPRREPIVLRFSQLPRILGIDIPTHIVQRILQALGNEILSTTEQQVRVLPPSWRGDLQREIDLVEEVARIHGYDKIPEDTQVPMAPSAQSRTDRVLHRVRQVLTAAGYDEAVTLSVVDADWADAFSPWSQTPPLRTMTPVIGRADQLRRSLVPSLLAARRTNDALGNAHCELFEIAAAYLPQPGGQLPREERLLALVSGEGFFEVKAVVEALLDALHLQPELHAEPLPEGRFPLLGRRAAQLRLGDELLGIVGEISLSGARRFELRTAATVAEVRLAPLIEAARLVPRYQRPSDFPAIVHDINLQVDEHVRWAELCGVVRQAAGELLESLQYRETYRNPQLAQAAQKKILFQVAYRSRAGTLTHDEANRLRDRIVDACRQQLGAQLG